MKSRFITDLQDAFDGFPNAAGAEIYLNFFPGTGNNSEGPLVSAPVVIPSTPALTSEAVQSLSAQSGSTSLVAMTAGGITINLLFDAAAMAAPASFRAGIQQAASILTAAISDQITVNIKIDYSGTGGGAAAGPDNGLYESCSSVRSDLINNATPGDATFNALPTGSSVQGQSNVAVWNAQLKLWGLLGVNDTSTDDGSATFATDINPNLLVGVALHELTHAMGRVPYGSPYSSSPDIFDLFRFTSPGVRLIDGHNSSAAAYFSIDGGNTKLADFGQNSDPSDFLNTGVQGGNDPFDEFYGGGTIQGLSAVDKQTLDSLGFHVFSPAVTTLVESFGSTSLVEVGSKYSLDPVSGGAGPVLKSGGVAITTGQFGTTWAPIGAEQTATGYEVAWKNSAADQYTVWATDSNGNFTSYLVGSVSGTSAALETLETSFHQDLNGDGTIGAVAIVIEALGSTKLDQVGSKYSLDPVSGGAGPVLKSGGVAITTGQFGTTWAPIGAEQTATGYEVAWKNSAADQYTVWATDSNGNFTSYLVGSVSGTSAALETLETSFHQDLNGDGTIGAVAIVIEALGSTKLDQVGSKYSLDPVSGGAGPVLKSGGVAITTGQFGTTWAPIGAEQTATGYEVAWKNSAADQYTVWATDSNGNFTSYLVGSVSGTSAALETLETSFHQDLNGDGGPPVFAGEYGNIVPIGAEATVPGTDQYVIWTTDSNGNQTGNVTGVVSGRSAVLKGYETIFHQDFNGNWTTAVVKPTAAAITGIEMNSRALQDNFNFLPNDLVATPRGTEWPAESGPWSGIEFSTDAGGRIGLEEFPELQDYRSSFSTTHFNRGGEISSHSDENIDHAFWVQVHAQDSGFHIL